MKKREAWREYARVRVAADTVDDSCRVADRMIEAEEKRFGPFESAEHVGDEVRTLRERVRELEGELGRRLRERDACKPALESLQSENTQLRKTNSSLIEERDEARAQLARSVFVERLSELLDGWRVWEETQRGVNGEVADAFADCINGLAEALKEGGHG